MSFKINDIIENIYTDMAYKVEAINNGVYRVSSSIDSLDLTDIVDPKDYRLLSSVEEVDGRYRRISVENIKHTQDWEKDKKLNGGTYSDFLRLVREEDWETVKHALDMIKQSASSHDFHHNLNPLAIFGELFKEYGKGVLSIIKEYEDKVWSFHKDSVFNDGLYFTDRNQGQPFDLEPVRGPYPNGLVPIIKSASNVLEKSIRKLPVSELKEKYINRIINRAVEGWKLKNLSDDIIADKIKDLRTDLEYFEKNQFIATLKQYLPEVFGIVGSSKNSSESTMLVPYSDLTPQVSFTNRDPLDKGHKQFLSPSAPIDDLDTEVEKTFFFGPSHKRNLKRISYKMSEIVPFEYSTENSGESGHGDNGMANGIEVNTMPRVRPKSIQKIPSMDHTVDTVEWLQKIT